MNETCDHCKQSLEGCDVIKVVDGSVSLDGEFDHDNTWTYHSDCVRVTVQ